MDAVVTGIGIVSALGLGKAENWASLCEGKSGVGTLRGIDTAPLPTKIGSQVDDGRLQAYLRAHCPRLLVKRSARFSQLTLAAAHMAVDDAGLDLERADRTRIGVLVGNSAGGLSMVDEAVSSTLRRRRENGLAIDDSGWWSDEMDPLAVVKVMGNCCAAQISILFGLEGPSFTVGTACASGATAIAVAHDMLRLGRADLVLVGGGDAIVSTLPLLGFSRLDALSRRNGAPQRASRPFDRERDGFVLGEGGAILVLETAAHARRRGARIYARLLASAMTSEAYNLTAPEQTGRGQAGTMARALDEARLAPSDIDYVSAHGTSTPLNDACETRAIKRAFGEHARHLWVSSQKSMLGHTVAAAGAIEAAVSALVVHEGVVPPTINLDYPDPECDLDYVPNAARERRVRHALSNSFGFGGHNSSIIFGAYDGAAA